MVQASSCQHSSQCPAGAAAQLQTAKIFVTIKARFIGNPYYSSKPPADHEFNFESSTTITHASGAPIALNSKTQLYKIVHTSTCQPFNFTEAAPPAPAPAPVTTALQARSARFGGSASRWPVAGA